MTEITKHSKSFVLLFGIAFVGAFLAFFVSSKNRNSNPQEADSEGYRVITYSPKASAQSDEPQITVDTSTWETYTNAEHGLSFKHDPDWNIRSVAKNQDGYYEIIIDPGLKYDNFRVYISPDDYYAMSGVPTTRNQIGGAEAINLDGAVLGVKHNSTYYTFDLGASLSLKPYFTALIDTVEFR